MQWAVCGSAEGVNARRSGPSGRPAAAWQPPPVVPRGDLHPLRPAARDACDAAERPAVVGLLAGEAGEKPRPRTRQRDPRDLEPHAPNAEGILLPSSFDIRCWIFDIPSGHALPARTIKVGSAYYPPRPERSRQLAKQTVTWQFPALGRKHEETQSELSLLCVSRPFLCLSFLSSSKLSRLRVQRAQRNASYHNLTGSSKRRAKQAANRAISPNTS